MYQTPSISLDVVEAGTVGRRGRQHCQIGEHIAFSTERLESYCFASSDPLAYDVLLVAAAVEFADRTLRRSAMRWRREIELRIPVHDPSHWQSRSVSDSLHAALSLLTGDHWQIDFCSRRLRVDPPVQGRFELPQGLTTVLPFSNGMDSCAVGGIMAHELGNKLIRVRLGSNASRQRSSAGRKRQPFAAVPYRVSAGAHAFVESSARSRGFKFALISGLAAYIANAGYVVVPESGQGALGPSLCTVGQAHEDYRSHPLFTERMEKFLEAVFGHRIRYQFPRLWLTKAETLKEFVTLCGDGMWDETWSCWQQTRQVSVEHKKRQCGICAACMLRRMSVHAAGLNENPTKYVWEDLSAADFNSGAAASFDRRKITGKLRDYAIAGSLHLDHLAGLRRSSANAETLRLSAFQLSRSLNLPEAEARLKLDRLLKQHASEWKNYVESLGRSSFVAQWADEATYDAA